MPPLLPHTTARLNAQDLVDRLRDEPARLRRVATRVGPRIGELGANIMRGHTRERFIRPKGPTTASIRWALVADGVRIGPTTPYTPYVNYGWGQRGKAYAEAQSERDARPGQVSSYAAIVGARGWSDRPGFAGHHFLEATAKDVRKPGRQMLVAELTREIEQQGVR